MKQTNLRGFAVRDLLFRLLCGVCILSAAAPQHLPGIFLLSALAHEAGHILVMVLMGVPVGGFSLCMGGAVLYGNFSRVSYLREAAVHFGGPAVNLLLCAVLIKNGPPDAASCNLLLALYNLFPLPGHDGMRGIAALLRAGGVSGQRMLIWISRVSAAVMLLFSGWILWYGALLDPEGVSFVYGGLFFCVLGGLYRRAAPDLRGKNKMDV